MSKNKKPYETITTGLIMRDGGEFDTEPRFRTLLLKGFIVYLVVMVFQETGVLGKGVVDHGTVMWPNGADLCT